MNFTSTFLKPELKNLLDNLKPKDALYVINRTESVGDQGKLGSLNFAVTDSKDVVHGVQIPATYLPIDLSMQLRVNHLRNSQQFRELLSKGLLEIVDTDKAEAMLSSPSAQAEISRLSRVGRNIEDVLESLASNRPASDLLSPMKALIKGYNDKYLSENIFIAATSELVNSLTSSEKQEVLRTAGLPNAIYDLMQAPAATEAKPTPTVAVTRKVSVAAPKKIAKKS